MSSSYHMRWRPALGVLVLGSIAIGLGVKGAAAEKARIASRDKSKDGPQAGVVSTPSPVSSAKAVSVPKGAATTESKAVNKKGANLPAGAVAVPNVVDGVVRPTNWVEPDELPNFTGVEALIGQAPTFEDSESFGSVAAGTTGACCFPDCAPACIGNQTQAACEATDGGTGVYMGNKSVCANDVCGCASRACCDPAGACIGDQTRAVCEAAGNSWNIDASCVGAGNRPLPICNQYLLNNCSWDNGLPLNDGGASRAHTHSGGIGQLPRYDFSTADDFILRGPESTACEVSSVQWYFRARPADTAGPVFTLPDPANDLIGINLTVYRNFLHPQTGLNQPGGHGNVPQAADDLNPKVSDTPGGIVYTRTLFVDEGAVLFTSLNNPLGTFCDPPPASGAESESVFEAAITVDPPILLNKNQKYWLAVQGLFPFVDPLADTLQTWWMPSQNNTSIAGRTHRTGNAAYVAAVVPSDACVTDADCSAYTGGTCVSLTCRYTFWQQVGPGNTQPGNAGNPTPCANVTIGTRVDFAFKLNGGKDLKGPPANDLCSAVFGDPQNAFDGVNPFDNTGADTDGPADCAVSQDIWFRYEATCTGVVTIKTCDSSFNSAVAVYNNLGCPTASVCGVTGEQCRGCDTAGCSGDDGSVQVIVAETADLLIRVGGDGLAAGKGILMIGCETICGQDDGLPLVNSCCVDHASVDLDNPTLANLGCENVLCCEAVCRIPAEFTCCDNNVPSGGWDSECVLVAQELEVCGCPCNTFTCTNNESLEAACASVEGNPGCSVAEAPAGAFEPTVNLALGVTVTECGRTHADANARDVDWYTFNVPATASGTATLTIELNGTAPVGLVVLGRETPLTPAAILAGEDYCFTKTCTGATSCGGAVSCATDADCTPPNTCATVEATLLLFDAIATSSCRATDGGGDNCLPLVTCVPAPGDYKLFVTTAQAADTAAADDDCTLGDGIFNGLLCGAQDQYQFRITATDDCLTGACCLFAGNCEDGSPGTARNEYECFVDGGTYQGDGSACEDAGVLAVCTDLAHGCATAQVITCGQTVTVDLTTDAHLPEEPYPCGLGGNDPDDRAWLRFVAPCVDDDGNPGANDCDDQTGTDTTSVRVDTCSSVNPGRDSLLGLYGTCCPISGICPSGRACDADTLCGGGCSATQEFATVGCSDDQCGFTDFLGDICATAVVEGETYYIQVSNWADPVNGIYQLKLSCPCTGSCCNPATAACSDGVPSDDCVLPSRFETQFTCGTLVPACGIGACCHSNGTCNTTNLAGCQAVGDNHNPGAACSTIICNNWAGFPCDYNTGDPTAGASQAFFGYVSQYEEDVDSFSEGADDFMLKGSVGNPCEISTVLFAVFHTGHDTDNDCILGGGGSGCVDNPSEYEGWIVTISEDVAGDEKGPTCKPICSATNCTPGPDGDYHDDETTVGCQSYLLAGGPLGKGDPIPTDHYWTYTTNKEGQAEHYVTLHFVPPIPVEKNKKNWLAVTLVMPLTSRYEVVQFSSNNFNGNYQREYNSLGTQEFELRDGTPNDLLFAINGDKVAPGCGTCELFGDIAPLPAAKCLIDVDDLLCELDSFSGIGVCGTQQLGDIVVTGGGCGPDDPPNTDVDDLLAVLAAFSGVFACPSPCPEGACLGDFNGVPPPGSTCRDGNNVGSFFVGNGMSESDCFNLTGGTGTYCGDFTECLTSSTCAGP